MSVKPKIMVSNVRDFTDKFRNLGASRKFRSKFLKTLAVSVNESNVELGLNKDQSTLKLPGNLIEPQTCTTAPDNMSFEPEIIIIESNFSILDEITSDKGEISSESCSDSPKSESSKAEKDKNDRLSKLKDKNVDVAASTSGTNVISLLDASKIYSESGKYMCTFKGCKAEFARPSKLQTHLFTHAGIKPYVCPVDGCSKAYSSSSHLNRHKLTHHEKKQPVATPFVCEMEGCGKVLKNRYTLMKHISRAHVKKKFTCSICCFSFPSSEKLTAHSLRRHNGKSSHQCDECNVSFSRIRSYNRHMRKHRLHICPVPGCSYTSNIYNALRTHISVNHPKRLECHYCGKTVKDKTQMRKHCRRHLVQLGLDDPLPEKYGNYLCHSCPAVLTTKGSLKRHVYVVHESVKAPPKVKKGDERAPRWDKGVPKKSVAAFLSSSTVPPSLQLALLTKEKHSDLDSTSNQIVQLMIDHINKVKTTIETNNQLLGEEHRPTDEVPLSPTQLNTQV